ncbi:Pentatricopeptide repeat [Dillenia turbinata]|uniref:Pentatricopeptide repeat n=1 Tax=Dillenia turbinata TaxID=194707 RepID=A0AAN8Z9E0_9MAGN
MNNRTYWTRKIHFLCTKDHNVDEALRLLNHLRVYGYKPDSLNISSIIHGLCNSRRFAEAHNQLLLFIASDFVPDERTRNVLIARLLDSKTPLTTLHPEFVPSLINYGRLIDQLCLVEGIFPNAVTCTTLIGGFCRIGEVGVAQKLFDEMTECGAMPNSLTCSVLICGIFRQRDIENIR